MPFARIVLLMTLCLVSFPLRAEQAATGGAPAGDAQQEFQQVFEEWKVVISDLRALPAKFKGADAAEQAKIREQYERRVAEARQLTPRLQAAAEKAYAAAPNQNEDVTWFMGSALSNRVMTDDYEEALRLASMLIDNDAKVPGVHMMGGVAAFVTNQHDLAEKYFAAAHDKGEMKLAATSGRFPKELTAVASIHEENLDEYRDLWAKEQKVRAAEAQADDLPRVKLQTSKGDLVVELFENEAPNTTANFVNLVEKGFYDGLKFHRVLPGFMAQAGCPKGDGTGGPGYRIACECYQPNHRKHFRGTLSMAKGAARDTGGSQFFLTFVPTSHLDGKHTAFGRVIEGMDVLAKLQRIDPQAAPAGTPTDRIVKATIVRKRDHDYTPKKAGSADAEGS